MTRVDPGDVRERGAPGAAEVGPLLTRRAAAEQWRETVDLLDLRAHLLDHQDRALLRMHVEAGLSFHEIARWTGLSPSTVCRRIHRMIHRLSDPTYPICLGSPRHFTRQELDMIRDHFVRGLSLRRLCRRRHLGHRRLQRIIAKARRMTGAPAAV